MATGWGVVWLGLAATSIGCATTRDGSGGQNEEVAQAATPLSTGAKPVQVVKMDGPEVEGQTSWQIRPAVSLLPPQAAKQGDSPRIAPHIEQRMQYAFDLAQRGAVYSAYAEFQNVIGMCATELDAIEGGSKRRDAAREGFVALEEVEEFSAPQGAVPSREIDVKRIAAAHQTPMQDRIDKESWDREQAIRAYYEFAMSRIELACRDSAAAPNALYGMGRTAALLNHRTPHSALRAMLLFDLTLRVDPTHSLAANELGVLFAQNGRFEEAEKALLQAVAHGGTSESWKNLATVYGRLGKPAESELAMQRSVARAAPGLGSEDSLLASGDVAPSSSAESAANNSEISENNEQKEDGGTSRQTVSAESLRQNLLRRLRR